MRWSDSPEWQGPAAGELGVGPAAIRSGRRAEGAPSYGVRLGVAEEADRVARPRARGVRASPPRSEAIRTAASGA